MQETAWTSQKSNASEIKVSGLVLLSPRRRKASEVVSENFRKILTRCNQFERVERALYTGYMVTTHFAQRARAGKSCTPSKCRKLEVGHGLP